MPSSLSFLVTGRVQGVGYRAFARSLATEHGLVGRCRNTPDGAGVEGVVQGELRALQEFRDRLWDGPGKVEDVKEEVKEVDQLEYRAFGVRR
ncbi:acylphosphatase [Calocera cornea HHB12733]|uniref:acylphosphatase n=1 Tax=Calocera cornea HHB12733 TaxID=1353952 RepID=A0A165DPG6_9BASI|nr:acylphosphatase [Calocera cornea HHB12733]